MLDVYRLQKKFYKISKIVSFRVALSAKIWSQDEDKNEHKNIFGNLHVISSKENVEAKQIFWMTAHTIPLMDMDDGNCIIISSEEFLLK